jgi:hypothetical protein
LNFKARASGGFGSDGINAAVINLRDRAARDTDQVMVMGGFARNIGVSAIGEVNSLNKVLVGEEFKQTEDGGAPNTEAALLGIGEEIGGGEVPLSTGDQGGELTARPGKTDPRLVKRLEQLTCHEGTIPELRLSLNKRWVSPSQAREASTGMIHP